MQPEGFGIGVTGGVWMCYFGYGGCSDLQATVCIIGIGIQAFGVNLLIIGDRVLSNSAMLFLEEAVISSIDSQFKYCSTV